MRNSKAVLTSCMLLFASGAANAQVGANNNLPPTADDVIWKFRVLNDEPNGQQLVDKAENADAISRLPPGVVRDSGDSKPREFGPKSDVPAAPDSQTTTTPPPAATKDFVVSDVPDAIQPPEPWVASTPAMVFGQQDSLTNQVSPALSGNDGCGESCQPYRRCVGDNICRMLTFHSGFAFMSRSDPSSGVLFANSVQPTQQLNAGDFDFGLQSGIEAGVVAHGLFTDFDLDLRFLGVGDNVDSQRKFFTSSGMPISTPTQFYVVGPRRAEAEMASSLRSFEANLRYRYGGGHRWWSMLAGFRYLAIEERMATRLTDPAGLLGDSFVTTGTANHLYGAQIGIDAPLLGGASYNIDCYGRVGLYGNNSSTATGFDSGTPGGSTFNAKREGGAASFVGELGIKATCRLSDAWNLYGRYQVLFIDDVALASQQFNSQHTTHGEVAFQGGTFGLEYVY